MSLDVPVQRPVSEAATSDTGGAARTVTALSGLRVTMIALNTGCELAGRQAPGAATLVCLAGSVRLTTTSRNGPCAGTPSSPFPPNAIGSPPIHQPS